MTPYPIQTARLTLRSYTSADIPDLVRLAGAREVAATTLRIPHPYTERMAADWLASVLDGDEGGGEGGFSCPSLGSAVGARAWTWSELPIRRRSGSSST